MSRYDRPMAISSRYRGNLVVTRVTAIFETKFMRHLAALGITAAGFVALLWVCGWFVQPDMDAELSDYSSAEVADATALRDNAVDPGDTLAIWREVAYGRGVEAAWYPKGARLEVFSPLIPSEASQRGFARDYS